MNVEDTTMPKPYHNGRGARGQYMKLEDRPFIAWDGEGINLKGKGKPQSYVLFGCSTGEAIRGKGLRTHDLCDFIVDIGKRNPGAVHVGFAFSYDANMIVQSLHSRNLAFLHHNGYVSFHGEKGKYCIQLRRNKWLSVTRYEPSYDVKHNPNAKTTVRIFDLFGFFTCSFVKAVEEMLGKDAPGLDIVREGKALRKEFTYDELDYVEHYWRAEIELLRQCACELRKRLYGAGLKINTWHGPGALASYALKQHGIKDAMTVTSDEVREASRYAYAGGRFELYRVGKIDGPIYSLDIRSAYPFAISQLPSLSNGCFTHVVSPTRVARFGVYRMRVHIHAGFSKRPGPVFHRDDRHNISYPWNVEGWYFSPEVVGLLGKPGVEVLEGWEFHGDDSRPFAWVADMYEQRRQWKEDGNSLQLALKLCMNSLYGKMAQRVGWDERTGRIPPWHQLEWAGWVTSYTRSMLYNVMSRIPFQHLIAVETDGLYTTYDPAKLGITESTDLGGWEVAQYDEVMYVQSGLAWLRKGDQWIEKRRGLDPGTFSLTSCEDYLASLRPNEKWEPFIGQSTRFVGLGAALASEAPLKVKHCVWETTNRRIVPGEHGKRIHAGGKFCNACQHGHTALEEAHDLVIRSLSQVGVMSTPHYIPWEGRDNGATADWREYEIAHGDNLARV